ncbi:efflux RND transporter permease subunit [Microbacteriaceae bacterium 4G12]
MEDQNTNERVLQIRVQTKRSVREALIEAGISRLRPIIMTAEATIIALVPLATGASEGGLMSKSLAIVVIGGLISSTLLISIVVPIIFELIESMVSRREKAKERKREKTERHFIRLTL